MGAPGRSGPAGARGGASRQELEQRTYDPRREERRKATRIPLPDDVEPQMLDADARKELRTLTRETSDLVARHLVVTGQLLDDDPAQALAHARAARALAGRVGVVREAAGLAAYAAGEWAEALSELRAARRITGEPAHLAVAADCERALGRPERALAYGDDPAVPGLAQEQRVELIIVMAGARRDLGQQDAAVLVLQEPARRTSDKRPWAARLWYAYADALLTAGRDAEAQEWFGKAAAVDVDGHTDAGDRLLLLEGVVLDDPELDLEDADEAEREDLPTAQELAELVRDVPAPGFRTAEDAEAVPEGTDAGAPQDGPEAVESRSTASQRRVPPPGGSDTSTEASEVPRSGTAQESVPDAAPRPRVVPPTFVAPPGPEDDEDLRLFD